MEQEQLQSNLRKVLAEQFNTSEIRDLCFDLRIDYERLTNDTKGDLARELISYCDRHDLLSRLIRKVLELRPNVSFMGKIRDVAVNSIDFTGVFKPEPKALVTFSYEDTREMSTAWVRLKPNEADIAMGLLRAIEKRLLFGETPLPEEARMPKGLLES
jgi:hypothetical protein